MHIAAQQAQIIVSAIDVDGMLRIEELRLDAENVEVGAAPDAFLRGDVRAALVIAESSVNQLLAGRKLNGARDLQIAMLAGRVRVSGKRALGPVGIPFAIEAGLEIESGTRIRLDTTRITVVGAPLPNMSLGYLGDWLNQQLAGAFDASKLPIPVRLTGLTLEPGRLTLHGVTRLDLRPGARRDPFSEASVQSSVPGILLDKGRGQR